MAIKVYEKREVFVFHDFAIVPLTQGYTAIIDLSDVEEISKHNWCVSASTPSHPVAVTWTGGRLVMMHRFIVKARKGQTVDHANRDSLDNRRGNLRKCTASQNLANCTKRRDGASRFKGVSLAPNNKSKPWRATIQIGGKRSHLGYFSTQEEAFRKYSIAAARIFGKFARLDSRAA